MGCSKQCFDRFEVVDRTDEGFEPVDKTDEVSSKHCFEVADRTEESVSYTYGKVKLTWDDCN
ncbi:hypothetical protein [Streptococcus pneumoniae]|uniref:hypothetical protein n=1 Tax=Streptococcus pneumoniae TaxID=1313 RepID=UPI0015C5F063|nr:hypothetical protein [Streptococcus pneumoniae]